MDEDTLSRLDTISERLHMRALALSHSEQDNDIASLMSALAVTMEAVRSMGVTLNRMDGLQGLGAAGD